MKTFWILALTLLLPSAAIAEATVEDQVRTAVADFNASYAANDLETYFAFYDESATVFFGQQRSTVADYRDSWRQLIEGGHAYPCFCTPERLEKMRQEQQKLKQPLRYDGLCRNLDPDEAARRVAKGEKHVVRFKMPQEGSITVNDYLRGEITVENSNLDDSILVRTDGLPVYHLAAMADDYDMKITHVVRGSEWLPSFPLHAHVIHALGWPMPEFLHLSVFLKPSGKGKMSKRESAELIKDGFSIFVGDLQELGYLPEGVVNWVALMGWSYDDHTEFFKLSR